MTSRVSGRLSRNATVSAKCSAAAIARAVETTRGGRRCPSSAHLEFGCREMVQRSSRARAPPSCRHDVAGALAGESEPQSVDDRAQPIISSSRSVSAPLATEATSRTSAKSERAGVSCDWLLSQDPLCFRLRLAGLRLRSYLGFHGDCTPVCGRRLAPRGRSFGKAYRFARSGRVDDVGARSCALARARE